MMRAAATSTVCRLYVHVLAACGNPCQWAVFEEISGSKFTVTHVREQALRAQRASAADSLQEAFASLILYYAHVTSLTPSRHGMRSGYRDQSCQRSCSASGA